VAALNSGVFFVQPNWQRPGSVAAFEKEKESVYQVNDLEKLLWT